MVPVGAAAWWFGTSQVRFGFETSVWSLSHVQLFAIPWTAAHQASLSITNSLSLLKLMSVELMLPSNYLILCRPLLLLPSIFLSMWDFSDESVLHIRWPKYWSFSFSFSISPSSEYSGLISFRKFKFPNSRFPASQEGLVGSPCSPTDSQESSPTPQFKSINSLVISFLYDPNLISKHDYWKNHSFD